MKKELEKQIQEIADIISHLEEGDIDVDSLMGLDELLDLLSNKIKSTKLGHPLHSNSKLLESVRHEAIFIFDLSLKVHKYTGIFDHLFYPEKTEALKVTDLLKITDPQGFMLHIERLLSSKEIQEFDTRIHSAQGIPLTAKISLELLSESIGKELIMAGVNFANTTLTDIKNYQQIVIENLPDIDVFLFDDEYRYVLAGGREKERFGLSNSFFPGKTLFEVYDDKVSRRLFPFYRKALDGEMADGEIRMQDQIYYIWATPVKNFYDHVVGGTAILQNVTKDKEVEFRLKKAKDDAQQADQAKSTFLANMSHEIRTPLNAIIGFTEQLSKSDLDEKQEKFVQFISESSEHLLSLVNEILILFKLGMGKVFIDKLPFNITQVLNVIYNSFIIKANEKKIHLSVQVDPKIPETIVGDPFRLRQIVINLVSNALKYTDEGWVEVRCVLAGDDPEHIFLRFEVEDTGSGISPAMMPHIFDEFTQSSTQPDKKRKGAGLGLTICKKLVELMEGHIEVESEPDQGSLFSVSIPFLKASEKDKAENENHFSLNEDLLKGKKILFADDDKYNLLLTETVLTNWKTDFKLARNGLEAVNLLEINTYDIILLDIHMPKMNGLEVVKKVRKEPENPNYETKILAVTANVLKSDIKIYINEGFDGYVLKPFKEKELYNKICNMLELASYPENNNDEEELDKEPDTLNTNNMFDTQNLYLTSNGDHAFFNKMIDTFVRNTTNLLNEFELQLKDENWKEIGEKAHRAIPSFKYFALNNLVDELARLENLALRDKKYEEIPEKTEALIEVIKVVVDQAKKAKLDE